MPANLTPDYRRAEQAFREATTVEEKIAALERMLAVIPKHKGTDHLQADLKRRLAKLRDAQQSQAKKKGFDVFRVERAPRSAGQVVLLGPPNAGKSALLARLTHAHPEVAPYPFTTKRPLPGMMPFEGAQVQLVDLPPIAGGELPPGMLGLVKSADAAIAVVDLAAEDVLEETEALQAGLERGRVRLHRPLAPPDPPLPDEPGWRGLPALLAGTRIDVAGAADAAAALHERYGARLPVHAVSAETGEGLEALREAAYRMLDRIRVYGKAPGRPPDRDSPFVLPRGATVLDYARHVHRDFPDHLKLARLYGPSGKFDGVPVPRDHVLADGDCVELHVDI